MATHDINKLVEEHLKSNEIPSSAPEDTTKAVANGKGQVKKKRGGRRLFVGVVAALLLVIGVTATVFAIRNAGLRDPAPPHDEDNVVSTEPESTPTERPVQQEAEESNQDIPADQHDPGIPTDENIPSIDYRDYDIDYETTSMLFHEFPLEKLVAYYLGGDGAYSYGASYELRDRFLDDPDEMVEYIALVGDLIVRGEPVKILLCDAIMSLYFFGDSDIPFEDSARTILEDLTERYKLRSDKAAEVVVILNNKFEASLEEFNSW